MQLPQTPLELAAGQITWAHKNINNNLDFVPDDKLNWKPAPSSKSVSYTHLTLPTKRIV